MAVFSWPEIEGFHNIRAYLKMDPGQGWQAFELLGGKSTVHYKSKVKLHGTNCAVQLHADGRVIPQSRTTDLSVSPDQLGFARFIKDNETAWKSGSSHNRAGMVIYGEWVGPGVQKSNVAVSDLPGKVFAIFAARHMSDGSDLLVVEPEILASYVRDIPGVYVIPWYEEEIIIDWKHTDEQLNSDVEPINNWVATVEAVDPWVKAEFGKEGMGEGLVFYPVSHPGLENFKNLAFKAKGAGHRVVKQSAPVQVNAEVAASVDQFVDMVLTEARLEQGTATVSGFDKKKTGQFVSWIVSDVKKETQAELSASNLTWNQVEKSLATKARTWYLAKTPAK